MNERGLVSFNLSSTWGISALRDETVIIGTGASIGEHNGHIKLSTGTSSDNFVQLRTLERGQYIMGSKGEVLIGVHLGDLPSGTQDVYWGYCDGTDGVGFGVDVLGGYIYRRIESVIYKIHQQDWPNDRLDGTGPSRIELDFRKHNTFQLILDHNALRFVVHISNSITKQSVVIEVATIITSGEGIENPNQPLSVYAINGNTSNSNMNVFVSGRSYKVTPGDINIPFREVSEAVTQMEITSLVGNWYPLIAIRRKTFHGPSSKPNSVRTYLSKIEIGSDHSVEYKITIGNSVSGQAWGSPTDYTSTESAVETIAQTGSLVSNTNGLTVFRGLLSTLKKTELTLQRDFWFLLGGQQQTVLWVRKIIPDSPIVSAIFKWKEYW